MNLSGKLKTGLQGRPTRVVAALACAVVMAVWVIVAILLSIEKTETEAGAFKDATNFARIFEEHTVRTLQSVDQTARFVKRAVEVQGRAFDLVSFLRDDVNQGGVVNLVTVADENGEVIHSTKPSGRVNLADREHFRVHMAVDSGQPFISKPVLGRVSGKWSVQLTRRINKPDGKFGGVVIVSMDPFYFTRLYRDIDIGEQGAIFVVADDGILRARRSAGTDSIGQDLRGGKVFAAATKANQGTIRAQSLVDASDRFYAFRRLDGFPLIAGVGIGVGDAMLPYIEYRNMLFGMSALITLVTILLSVILVRSFHQLESSRQRAVEANEAKSDFLANMSHELRTPLNGILGYAELLEMDLAETPQLEFARAISHSGEHLLALVNSVLDLAKVESGKLLLQVAPQDVAEIVRHTMEGHLSSAMKKGLDLRFELDPVLPRRCLIDRMRMVQVLNNLIHNAIKFTDRGAITVSATVAEGQLLFGVRDTGPGIDPKLQRGIFDKFVQVDSSERRNHTGTGLGLALVRELIELMGGNIWIDSDAGAGAFFRFTVPIRAA